MAAAKQIRDEIMKMTIIVNSNPAQQEIYALTEANRKFTQQSKELRDERTKVGQTLGRNSQEYKDLTAQINSNSTSITANNRKVKELGDSLDVSQMSVKQLKQEAILLRRELDRVVPGSDQYKALDKQLVGVNTRLTEVRNGTQASSTGFSKLATEFNHYSGLITAGIAILYGFGTAVNNIIARNNKMADAMTAVAKTTGMATGEVDELNKSFSEFDTRTARVDLLKIAEIGGRLGVAKGDIKDFTREVDKAYVALGDGFAGGVEAVANKLGKIKGLFKETKELNISVAMNQIGSALNELGAAGAASEENISEFALRVGGLPDSLKPTVAEALALGAAFEEGGVNAERAGSAYASFVSTAAKDIDKFAKVMGVSTEAAKKLINTNPTEFFLQFSESVKGMDATKLAATLDYLKLNDQYVKSIVGNASENIDRYRGSIDLSNKSLAQATSLQTEFDKVNNNAAAIYEKMQKKFLSLFTSTVVSNFINSSVEAFGKFIGAIKDADGTATSFRIGLVFLVKVIALMIATMLSYNILTGVYNGLMKTAYERILGLTVIEKARNLVNGIATIIQTSYNLLIGGAGVLFGRLTGATAIQTVAQERLNLAMASNPFGAVLALVGLLVAAYYTFAKSTEEVAKNQNLVNIESEISNRMLNEQAKSVGEMKSKIDPYIQVLKDEKSQLSERKKAYEDLIKISPEFKDTLDKEYRATDKLTAIYDSLIKKIKEAAQVRALTALLDEQATKREKLQSYSDNVNTIKEKIAPATTMTIGGKKVSLNSNVKPDDVAKVNLISGLAEKANSDLAEIDSNIDNITKKIVAINTKTTNKDNNFTPPDDTADKGSKKDEKAKEREAARLKREEDRHQKEMDAYRHQGDESAALARQIQLDIEDAKIEAMAEGFDKELAALNLQEKRKLEEIDKKEITKTEFNKIDEKITTAKGEDKKLFEALKASWIKNNTDLETEKTAQKLIFEQKRKTLNIKFETEKIKEKDDDFKREISNLEREKNEKLAVFQTAEDFQNELRGKINEKDLENIKTYEEGKKALTEYYQKKEIAMQIAHLEEFIKIYEDFAKTITDPAEQKKLLQNIDEAKDKVAELKATLNDKPDPKGDSKSKLGRRGSADILGMSTDDWKTFIDNIKTGKDALGTVQAAVQAVQAAFAEYYNYIQAQEQAQAAQIDKNAKRKEDRLKKMLATGQINQEQYDKEIQKLNEATEKQKAELAYKSAKQQKAMAIANGIAGTAVAVIGALGNKPWTPLNFALAGIVGALGLVQVATIAAQPLPEAPGYEQGFGAEYDMRREQDGKQFRVKRQRLSSGLVNRPTHFIAGENGVEMVIDSPTYAGFRPEVKRMLHQEISYSRGYEGGLYPQNNGGSSSNNDDKYMMIIQQNTEAMNAILGKKFVAYVGKTMENAKEIIDLTNEYSGYKNASKK